MVDSYYTPSFLASRLVDHVKTIRVNNVVDFCIGDGELIRAALKIWPNIKCYGTDISENTLKVVRKNHPDWILSKCNLLNEDSRERCNVIKSKKDGFDLVLLNPPFSCIGGTIHEVDLNGITFKVSTAMKFMTESLKYLSAKGCLLAIMPISICYSQKDKKLWDYLVEKFNLSILEIPNGNFFKNCSPSIVFVSINFNHSSYLCNNHVRVSLGFSDYTIFRGKISMHDAKNDKQGYPFIHSTNIRNNNLENLNISVLNKSSGICGPAVILPRVGKPNHKKMCIINKKSRYILSDCVLAIQTKNITTAKEIYKKLLDNWDFFTELYKGTGARFITIERLNVFLCRTKVGIVMTPISFPSSKLEKPTKPTLQQNFTKDPSIPSLANAHIKRHCSNN